MGKVLSGSSWVAACVGIAVLVGAHGAQCGTPAPNPVAGDPLIGFHFALTAGTIPLGYFTDVDGIGSENDVVEHKVINEKGLEIVQKIPGRLKFLDVTLKRGITGNLDAWAWRAMVENGDVKGARKNVTITMFDQTLSPVAEWTLDNAWPSRIVAPGVTSASGSFAVEELTLVNEGYTRTQ